MDHYDLSKCKPMTLKEIKESVNMPVWVKVINKSVFADPTDAFDSWGMVRKSWVRVWDDKRHDLVKIDYDFSTYGKDWVAFSIYDIVNSSDQKKE